MIAHAVLNRGFAFCESTVGGESCLNLVHEGERGNRTHIHYMQSEPEGTGTKKETKQKRKNTKEKQNKNKR